MSKVLVCKLNKSAGVDCREYKIKHDRQELSTLWYEIKNTFRTHAQKRNF